MKIHKFIEQLIESEEHYSEKLFYSVWRDVDGCVREQQVYAPSIVEAIYMLVTLWDLLRTNNPRWVDYILTNDSVGSEEYSSTYDRRSSKSGTILAPDSIAYEFSEGGFRAVSTSKEWVEKQWAAFFEKLMNEYT